MAARSGALMPVSTGKHEFGEAGATIREEDPHRGCINHQPTIRSERIRALRTNFPVDGALAWSFGLFRSFALRQTSPSRFVTLLPLRGVEFLPFEAQQTFDDFSLRRIRFLGKQVREMRDVGTRNEPIHGNPQRRLDCERNTTRHITARLTLLWQPLKPLSVLSLRRVRPVPN